MIIPNIWKVIKFHGSSHHQPDRFRFNPLTSSLLVRYIMLYYISQSLPITNHQPVKDIWIAPSKQPVRETPFRTEQKHQDFWEAFAMFHMIINHMINHY